MTQKLKVKCVKPVTYINSFLINKMSELCRVLTTVHKTESKRQKANVNSAFYCMLKAIEMIPADWIRIHALLN